MSYLTKIEYEIVLKESFSVIRGCSGCGKKTHFKNTKKFRVNANGSRLDIWLIYQCEKCRHTFNLAIYERKGVSSISKEEYQRFLSNDEQLAGTYGKNMQIFQKNRADIDFERLDYEFVKLKETTQNDDSGEKIVIEVHNPHELKIRPEKQIAGALGLSTNRVRKMLLQGEMEWENSSPKSFSVCMRRGILSSEETPANES